MSNEKYIADLRSMCKDQTDHEFVDSVENIITEFEKPYKEPKYFIPIGKFTEDWDAALKQLIDQHIK